MPLGLMPEMGYEEKEVTLHKPATAPSSTATDS